MPMVTPAPSSLLPALLLCACSATSQVAATASPGGAPAPPAATTGPAFVDSAQRSAAPFIEGLMKREQAPRPPTLATSPECKLRLQAEAAGPIKFKPAEGLCEVQIPIEGASTPLTCYVYNDRVDPGQTLAKVLSSPVPDVHKRELTGLTMRAITAPAEAGMARAALFATQLYLMGAEPAQKLGQFKVSFVSSRSLCALCLHDEVGFEQTFRRGSEQLFTSLERTAPASRPPVRTQELARIRIGSLDIGYSETLTFDGPAGRREVVTISSMLLPRAPGEVAGMDDARSEVFDKGGLLEGHYASVQGGEVDTQLQTTRRPQGGYDVAGTFKGKELKSSFQSAAPLLSADEEQPKAVLALRREAARPQLGFAVYEPSANPLGATEVSVRRSEGDAFLMKMGGNQATLRCDTSGHILEGTLELGPNRLQMERIHAYPSP